MALKTEFTSPSAVYCADAYVRVISGMWSAHDGVAAVEAWVYTNEAARRSGAERLARVTQTFALDPGAELFAQAYAALRAMPEFANAVDV